MVPCSVTPSNMINITCLSLSMLHLLCTLSTTFYILFLYVKKKIFFPLSILVLCCLAAETDQPEVTFMIILIDICFLNICLFNLSLLILMYQPYLVHIYTDITSKFPIHLHQNAETNSVQNCRLQPSTKIFNWHDAMTQKSFGKLSTQKESR